MANVTFTYKGEAIKIECNKDDKMKDIINKFIKKKEKEIDINSIYFLYNSNYISYEKKFNEQANIIDKENNEMQILVIDLGETILINKERKEIICQECKEKYKIKISDYKTELVDCNENPKNNNILLDENNNAKNIDESNAISNICKQNISLNKEFYKCLICEKEIYPSSESMHDIESKIKDYVCKNYICNNHKQLIISYCNKCKIKLCESCELEHENHKIIKYLDILPDENKIKEEIKEFSDKIDKLNKKIKNITTILNKIKENIGTYYGKVNNYIINDYKKKDMNYKILYNFDEIKDDLKVKDIDEIINNNNINDEFKNSLNIYNNMIIKIHNFGNLSLKNDEIKDTNEIKNNDNNKGKNESNNIINENKNNDNNGDINETNNNINKIKHKDKSKKKKKIIKKTKKKINKKEIESKNNIINDDNYSEISEINYNDNYSVTNESNYKDNYSDISEFKNDDDNNSDTNEIKNNNINKKDKKKKKINKKINNKNNEITIIYTINKNDTSIKLFDYKFIENNKINCKYIYKGIECELEEFLKLSNYKEDKLEIILKGILDVTDMSYMFCECLSLSSLPDISKWNTKNVTNMKCMLSNCSNLLSLSDISQWNTTNVTDMSYMFCECSSLSSLPDISKWNTNNVTDMSCMFSFCSSLSSLPDISQWNTDSVNNMSYMFYFCSSLSSLPDISNWNTYNVTDMSFMFGFCSSLSSLPKISNWNTNKVINMSSMFSNCSSLSSLPKISNWNTNNVINMRNMFNNCKLNIPLKFELIK